MRGRPPPQEKEAAAVSRLPDVAPEQVADPVLAERLRQQIAQHGHATGSTGIMARRPSIAHAWSGVFAGLGASGLLERPLRHLVNRRVALTVGCGY
jgi:hypothetical protein